jgi:hypothetical protein
LLLASKLAQGPQLVALDQANGINTAFKPFYVQMPFRCHDDAAELFGVFSAIVRLGPVPYGRATANKMWMS